jgi:hypothetical protein
MIHLHRIEVTKPCLDYTGGVYQQVEFILAEDMYVGKYHYLVMGCRIDRKGMPAEELASTLRNLAYNLDYGPITFPAP